MNGEKKIINCPRLKKMKIEKAKSFYWRKEKIKWKAI